MSDADSINTQFKAIGEKYDRLAAWWDEYHQDSGYGAAQVQRALSYATKFGTALDIGCGAGGRLVNLLLAKGFTVTGVDASAEMIGHAKRNHPDCDFIQSDIQNWNTDNSFDFILAWDSLFHMPLDAQKPVLTQICKWLNPSGIVIYSFGDAIGSHVDTWRGQEFPYSSIGITQNITTLQNNGLSILHLERDQNPDPHIFCIAVKERR